MNGNTHEIAAILNITLDEALLVQRQMEYNGVDFSAISQRAFVREVKDAYAEVNA